MSAKRTKPAKVPVILQMEALESGAASLCMILAYYKKWLTLDIVRHDCGVSRDGSTVENISAAAQSYGLDVKTEKYDVSQLKQQGEIPCIIWWNYNHFVVLNGFAGDNAVLNDPAMGKVTVSKEEFEESYSNLCIMLSPNKDFVPGGKPKSMVTFFLERAKGNGKALLLIVVTAALAAVAGTIIPSFNSSFTNILKQDVRSSENTTLTLFLFVFGFFILYHTVCQLFNIISVYKASGKMAVTSNFSFLWHLLRLPIDFFSQRYAGDLTSRQTENDKVAKTLVQIVVPTFIQIVLLLFYLFVMMNVSAALTFVGLLTVAANLFIARYIS
ncbi:MAG: NHLP family bacteriocin export ABC transporter peptidase/permease/ATPase, partial [Ruminococcus sp.]|nr:NHLP family bacteriocin export ABC transporter peptidase/permease/ATPase [Ruminococcus sp.]